MTGRQRILAAVAGDPVDQIPMVPISMMVAADQIGVPYLKYATDWQEQVRGQLAFADAFGVDHLSAISDPATEAADCGAEVIYHDNAPPALNETLSLLREKETLGNLAIPDPGSSTRMANRLRVVEELKRQGGEERIIEGWIEGPVAQACDLRGINRLMMDFYDDPPFVHELMEFVLELEMGYAAAQIKVGAEVIGIGDAAASLLGPDLYEEFAFPWQQRFIRGVHEMGALVRLHICGDSRPVFPFLPGLAPDILDLDSVAPVAEARAAAVGEAAGLVLTGNIDPVRVLRGGSAAQVYDAVEKCFHDAGSRGYMVAAGCEIPRGTPPENLAAMLEVARANRF